MFDQETETSLYCNVMSLYCNVTINCYSKWRELSYTNVAVSITSLLLTISGNIILLRAIVISQSYKSKFHRIVLNITVTDLIFGVIVDPFSVILNLKELRNDAIQDIFTGCSWLWYSS